MSVLPFDELNAFKENLIVHFDAEGHIASEEDCEDIIDELLDLYLLAVANGVSTVNDKFGTSIQPSADKVQEIVYKKIDGVTWVDRIWSWFNEGGTRGDIERIAETETHRDGNTAAYETAKEAGATTKTWRCMMLPTSRDTHVYLDGTTVGIDDEFYTYAGNSAQFPGQFGVAEEDCNCMCEIEFD